ncbi:MAG: hypothetical protein F6K11_30040, partial [Leptolyngbya sp. SIO3F4]|nr:hypothetical protein [Leptolyngbya sp. SIO3F4]
LSTTRISIELKSRLAQQVLAWTSGQPELTQYLQDKVVVALSALSQDMSQVSATLVDEQVKIYFSPALLRSKVPHDKPLVEVLARIEQGLLQDRQQGHRRLQYYQAVLSSSYNLSFDYRDERQALIDIGLLHENGRKQIKIASPIYRRIFNILWVEQKLEQPFILNKGHWLLLTSLLSILIFILIQSLFRYLPFSATSHCNEAADLRDAVVAKLSLNSQQMKQSIEKLRMLKEQEQLSPQCQDILHDLQYSYGIYISAGTHNHPLEAAKYLCQIPEAYYRKRNAVPWFSRWSNIYQGANFAQALSTYIEHTSCPGYDFLNRSSL